MPFAARAGVSGAALLAVAWALTGAGCAQVGKAENLASVDGAIVGGTLDTAHRGVVSLLKQVEGGYFPSCSGTLLTQNLVLTAHHCVASLSSRDGVSVDCGVTEFEAPERASTLLVSIEAKVGQEGIDPFRVADVWLPPNAGNAVCGKDIALLLLSGAGIPGSVATPIEPRLSNEVGANDVFAAVGYGLRDPNDEEGRTVGQRMSVSDAQVYCTGTGCGSELVTSSEWIADSPICSGDSGGPALDQNGRVSGVTSRGDAECTVGIYSSVYAWRDFIRSAAFDAAGIGHYDPPAWAGQPPPTFDPGTVDPVGGTSALGSGGSALVSGGSTSMGGSASLGGSNGVPSPTIDPLGLACTGHCPGAYLCWSATGQPPGMCVPACGEAYGACPASYACNMNLGACVPTTGAAPSDADDLSLIHI